MIELHRLIANAVVLYFAVLGLWGVVLAFRRAELDSGYRGALVLGVVLAIVQVLVGVVLVVTGLRPRDDLHYLYGLSLIVTLPLVQQYIARRRFSRVLAFGLASLFMMGLAIRAMTTGA